jgi:hypothetical protein
LGLIVAPLSAQPRPARISGVVTDGVRPLAEATVEIFGIKGARLTDSTGRFQFDSLRAGPYWLGVRRIGYAPITFTATLIAGATKRLEIQLQVAPYQLPELSVAGGMTNFRHAEFTWRKRGEWGRFYTRDDIARLRPFDLVDLVLRGLPGRSRFDLEQINWAAPAMPGYGGASWGYGSAGCPPAISRNGSTPWPGISLRDYELDEIEAVEVYRSRYVPLQFQNRGSGGCGLVVLWVR